MLATRVEEWQQQWKREGLREGEQRGGQRGEQRGRRQGKADPLLRQLERRFGTLPSWVSERVQTGDTGPLTEWSLRVLDATTLDAVFA
jgi:hypothetical protein